MLGNEESPGESVANGGYELSVNAELHYISEGARGQASAYEIGIGMNGQKNDPRSATGFLQSIGSRDAIENRHRNVRDDDIRLELDGRLKKGLAVHNLPHHLELWPQQSLHYVREAWVVVRQKYCWFAQSACL